VPEKAIPEKQKIPEKNSGKTALKRPISGLSGNGKKI
jgi:hypothetical protein